MASYEHIGVTQSGIIATIEVRRGPNNFVDTDMVGEIADVLEGFDRTSGRARHRAVRRGQAFLRRCRFLQPRTGRGDRGERSAGGTYIRRRSGCGAPASRSSPRCMARRWAPAWGWR